MNNTDKNSPEFKDKTEALEFMVRRSIDRKRKEKWAKEFAAERKINEDTKVIPLRKRIVQLAAVAAIFILGIVAMQFMTAGNQNLNQLATNMLENTKFQPEETTRGIILSEEELSKSLLDALESEDYKKALELYEQKSSAFSDEDKFFYAVSLAKTNNHDYDKILELTDELMKSKNEFFIESLWIRALTHLKMNESKKAKSELEELLRYKYQTKNVEELLSKIRAIQK